MAIVVKPPLKWRLGALWDTWVVSQYVTLKSKSLRGCIFVPANPSRGIVDVLLSACFELSLLMTHQ